jgi:hypothetical protein
MRILDILMDPSKVTNPRLNQRSRCGHCRRSYMFRRGILAKIEHKTKEIERDADGSPYLKRDVGVYACHSLECFLAMIEPDGHA